MTDKFREAMQQAGIAPPGNIQIDGDLHRFYIEGDKLRSENGWYVLHDNPLAGAFGSWKHNISETWSSKAYTTFTDTEKAHYRANMEAQKRKRETEQQRIHAECRERAAAIWDKAILAKEDHPYLVRKQVKPYKIRQYKEALVIQLRDGSGTLHGLQFINPDGSKKFLTGTAKAGHYFSIGGKPETVLYLAEGYATAATIHELTGEPVAVCFDAGNLKPVAEVLRVKLPDLQIVICADNDRQTEDNPGVTKGSEAAAKIGGLLAIPEFPDGVTGTDFNDLVASIGLDEIRRQIEAARAPEKLLPVMAVQAESVSVPIPLPDDLLPVEQFDYDLLPTSVRPWVADICDRLQCPPDFVAVAVMAAIGSLIGRKVGIRPQAKTDWTITANQWALVVGRPGVLKSPALEQALAPLKKLAAEANATYAEEVEEFQSALMETKLRADSAAAEAKKKLRTDLNASIADLLNQVNSPEEPTLVRYTANDTTPAALGELLIQNNNGLLIYRDELVSLLKSLDRDDQAEGRGFYLTGWNGDSGYTFDRIGRGMNLHIPAVCLSLLGGTQPGKLSEYVYHAVNGGDGDDGLLQRFGLLVWPDTNGEWKDVDRWPDTEAKREAYEVFNRLATLDPADVEAQQDKDANDNPEGMPYLRFDSDALKLFLEWRTNLEQRLRSGDLHPALESHFSKYRKLIPGLALIIHLAEDNAGPVTEQATLQALAWGDYLESHAQRAYGSTTQPEVMAAKEILKRIRKQDLKQEFSSRDVSRPKWSRLNDSKQVKSAIELLLDHNYLSEEIRTDTGGRPATIYHVNKGAA